MNRKRDRLAGTVGLASGDRPLGSGAHGWVWVVVDGRAFGQYSVLVDGRVQRVIVCITNKWYVSVQTDGDLLIRWRGAHR